MAKASETELESLDYAFHLSEEECADPKLRALYEVIVHRMRKEAERLPLSTSQLLMIERIAHDYVVMRQNERNKAYAHITQQKEYNAFWLAMTTELNKMLRAMEDKRQDKLLQMMLDVVLEVLNTVEDNKLRTELQDKLAEAFDKVGIV